MSEIQASPFAKIRSARAHELILEQLQSRIMSGKLAPGDRLPSERAMMTQFQVSRPTVREALRVAESMGLISVRSGDPGGTVVLGTPSLAIARALDSLLNAGLASASQLLELRIAIDSAAAVLASMQPKKIVAPIGEVLGQMGSTTDPDRFAELDARFHEAMIVASGNSLLELVFRGLIDSIRNLIKHRMTSFSVQDRERTLREHGAIWGAIRDGDSALAAEAVRQHLVAYYSPVLAAPEKRRFVSYVQAMGTREQNQVHR